MVLMIMSTVNWVCGGGDISMMIMTLMIIIENVVVTPWMASKWTSSVYITTVNQPTKQWNVIMGKVLGFNWRWGRDKACPFDIYYRGL